MEFVTNVTIAVAGFLLPAFATFKSLQHKTQQTRLVWLRYWVVFAVFYLFKLVADILLSSWLPFYYLSQILTILWLSSSKAAGANLIYTYALVPILKGKEAAIDQFLNRYKKHASVLFWHIASVAGSRWSETACHILHMYIQNTLAAASLSEQAPLAITHQVASDEDEVGSVAQSLEEEMFSDDESIPVIQEQEQHIETQDAGDVHMLTPKSERRKTENGRKRSKAKHRLERNKNNNSDDF